MLRELVNDLHPALRLEIRGRETLVDGVVPVGHHELFQRSRGSKVLGSRFSVQERER
jgi:hypothetical protein